MVSSVVSISSRTGRAVSTLAAINTAPSTRDSSMAVWTARWTPSSCRAPYRWAMTTTAPLTRPLSRPTVRLTTDPVQPTAARAEVPSSLPTTMVSTVLYIC